MRGCGEGIGRQGGKEGKGIGRRRGEIEKGEERKGKKRREDCV